MPRGTIQRFDPHLVAGFIAKTDGLRYYFAAPDVAPGQAGLLSSGVLADFTPYVGSEGELRGRNVRLASASASAQSFQVDTQSPNKAGTATVILYISALGGYLRDDATGVEFRFSDRVVVPVSANLQEGAQVSYECYASDRRGVWAKVVRVV